MDTGDTVKGDAVVTVATEAVLVLATPESGLFDEDTASAAALKPTSSSSSVELRLEM